jgi:hypothetical protein
LELVDDRSDLVDVEAGENDCRECDVDGDNGRNSLGAVW